MAKAKKKTTVKANKTKPIAPKTKNKAKGTAKTKTTQTALIGNIYGRKGKGKRTLYRRYSS